MLAYVYEKYGSLKAPVAAHMSMNLLSVLATRYGLYNWMLKDNIRIGIITVVCAAVASTMFVIIQRIEEKPTKKICPYCQSEISIKASRCPHCTSQLEN